MVMESVVVGAGEEVVMVATPQVVVIKMGHIGCFIGEVTSGVL